MSSLVLLKKRLTGNEMLTKVSGRVPEVCSEAIYILGEKLFNMENILLKQLLISFMQTIFPCLRGFSVADHGAQGVHCIMGNQTVACLP